MDLCHVVPAEKKINEAKDERLRDSNAEFNENHGKSLSGVDRSPLECRGAQGRAHSENPCHPWALEQTEVW